MNDRARKLVRPSENQTAASSAVAVLGPPKMLREALNGSLQKAAQQRLAERPRSSVLGRGQGCGASGLIEGFGRTLICPLRHSILAS